MSGIKQLPEFGKNKVEETISFNSKSVFASDLGEPIDKLSRKLYLTDKSILGEDYSAMWIDLCKYYPDREQ